jgi:flotillin
MGNIDGWVLVLICSVVGLLFLILIIKILLLRRIVPADMVHVVQTSKRTTSYGKNTGNGNVYYQWPKWLPLLGVEVKELPVSNFDMPLNNYEAYDKDRVPFVVDVRTFFRISDTNQAAEKVASTEELRKHLEAVVQGAVRNIMAKAKLEDIMEERSVYGQQFTDEVKDQLQEWGVVAVKNIELMDIRDSKDSNVIENIMAKKKSEIEKDSRITVATNRKLAQEAEIEAEREVEVKQADKEKVVGEKTAERDQMIGIANEKAKQQIAHEAEETAKKELAVEKVRQVTTATIKQEKETIGAETIKKTTIIRADEDKEKMKIDAEALKEKVKIDTDAIKYQIETKAEADRSAIEIEAEAVKFQIETRAEADKTAKEKEGAAIKTYMEAEAKGIYAVGTANADAEKLMQLARVTAETTLAEKIGNNEGYQDYLVKLETVKLQANVSIEQAKYGAEVGKAQAQNLSNADIKIITNTADGNVGGGVSKVMDLFSPKGGTALSGMLEAFAQTDAGKSVLAKIGLQKQDQPSETTEK